MNYNSIYSQSEILLNWFFDNHSSSIDIHVRSPKYKGADYNSDDWIWITQHEALSKDKAINLLSWCRSKNCNGSDIFIRPHRHDQQPILFMDDLTIEDARMVSRKYRSIIIETSHGNTQVWLALSQSLHENERKLAQQYIASRGLTDKGSISGEHLGRLCGYKSQKRNFWVKYIGQSYAPLYNPILAIPSTFPHGGACVKNMSGSPSMSERDFSWVLSNFRKGICATKLTELLTISASQRGKPAPAKYASRTVRRAMQILT